MNNHFRGLKIKVLVDNDLGRHENQNPKKPLHMKFTFLMVYEQFILQ